MIGRVGVEITPGEQSAERARQDLGVGLDAPISVLVVVESAADVPVAVQELPGDVAGLFLRRRGRALLTVNGNHPVVRQRFTLAHEFGHLYMGHTSRLETTELMWSGADRQEVEANYFAGAFLAPRQAVRNWADRHPDRAGDLETVVRMSTFFGTSAEASRIRLELSGVVSRNRSDALKRQIRNGEHHGVRAALGLTAFTDELSQLKQEVETGARELPRLPAVLVSTARRARDQSLMDEEDFEMVMRGQTAPLTGSSGDPADE